MSTPEQDLAYAHRRKCQECTDLPFHTCEVGKALFLAAEAPPPEPLLPCPFCGNARVGVCWVGDEDIAVHCGCGCTGPVVAVEVCGIMVPTEPFELIDGAFHPDVVKAVQLWNQRPETRDHQERDAWTALALHAASDGGKELVVVGGNEARCSLYLSGVCIEHDDPHTAALELARCLGVVPRPDGWLPR